MIEEFKIKFLRTLGSTEEVHAKAHEEGNAETQKENQEDDAPSMKESSNIDYIEEDSVEPVMPSKVEKSDNRLKVDTLKTDYSKGLGETEEVNYVDNEDNYSEDASPQISARILKEGITPGRKSPPSVPIHHSSHDDDSDSNNDYDSNDIYNVNNVTLISYLQL